MTGEVTRRSLEVRCERRKRVKVGNSLQLYFGGGFVSSFKYLVYDAGVIVQEDTVEEKI